MTAAIRMCNRCVESAINRMANSINSYFQIPDRDSTILTEIRAGTASFLTMSYLLLVNPQIMAVAGVPHSDAVFATAVSSAAASLIVGLMGNLPFGLAPGLGLSAYLSYGLVLSDLTDLREALTACFAAGGLLMVCALIKVTDVAMWVVPRSVKLAIVVGMGILIAMIGMVSVGMVVGNPDTLVALGDLSSLNLQVCLGGVVLIGTLIYHDIKGGILIGIATLTLLFWKLDHSFPTKIVELPSFGSRLSDFLDFGCLFRAERASRIYPAVFAFLFISIFDISGVMFGLSTLAGLIGDDGSVERSIWAFHGAACGTMIAAMTGSTPIILTVESASGVKEGGRTGLTAVTVGLYFLASLFLAPLFGAVPPEATAPVLILVGAMMMGESKKIEWETMNDAVPAFLTIVMMPLTYSITNGMVFGLVGALAFYFTTGAFCRDFRRAVSGMAKGGETDAQDDEGFVDAREEASVAGGIDIFLDESPMGRASFLMSKEDQHLIHDSEEHMREHARDHHRAHSTQIKLGLLQSPDGLDYGSVPPNP